MTKEIYRKHPLAIRWFHWINFPVLALMAWSGALIVWANDVFTAPGIDQVLKPGFFTPRVPPWVPAWVPSTIAQDDDGHPIRVFYDLSARLAEGMSWHFFFAWLFAFNGVAYVLFLAFSGQWRQIVPRPKAFGEAVHVVLHDLRLSKRPLPLRKYNAAQQIAYTGVILMGGLMLATGLAIYKPSSQSWLTHLLGGYTVARFLHFWTTLLFVLFFFVHVGQVIRTGWNNFRGMITGVELVAPEERAALESRP